MAEITERRPSSVIHSRPSPPPPTPRSRIQVKPRTQLYLLGNSLSTLKVSKLPKNCDVLARFVTEFREGCCKKTAANEICDEVIDVWKHHFGIRLTLGKEYETQKTTDESMRFILRKDHNSWEDFDTAP